MFSNLLAFVATVEGVSVEDYAKTYGGYIDDDGMREEFSTLVWDHLLPVEQNGCKGKGFTPVLLDKARLPEAAQAAKEWDAYYIYDTGRSGGKEADVRRLEHLLHEYESQFKFLPAPLLPREVSNGVELVESRNDENPLYIYVIVR